MWWHIHNPLLLTMNMWLTNQKRQWNGEKKIFAEMMRYVWHTYLPDRKKKQKKKLYYIILNWMESIRIMRIVFAQLRFSFTHAHTQQHNPIFALYLVYIPQKSFISIVRLSICRRLFHTSQTSVVSFARHLFRLLECRGRHKSVLSTMYYRTI